MEGGWRPVWWLWRETKWMTKGNTRKYKKDKADVRDYVLVKIGKGWDKQGPLNVEMRHKLRTFPKFPSWITGWIVMSSVCFHTSGCGQVGGSGRRWVQFSWLKKHLEHLIETSVQLAHHKPRQQLRHFRWQFQKQNLNSQKGVGYFLHKSEQKASRKSIHWTFFSNA